MSRARALALLSTAALTTTVLIAPSAGAATTAKAPVGAGYLASPAKVRSASMVVRVPTITCGPKSTTTIQTGMFGTIDQRVNGTNLTEHWSLVVVAACHSGSVRYRAEQGGGDPSDTLPVHPGDRIKLIQQDADDYEIDNLSRGDDVGGGAMGGPGETDTLVAPVLFGVQVSGAVRRATPISVLQAHLSRTQLNKIKTKRRRQVRNGSPAATVAGLRSPGAFDITIDQT